jgi:23S rRNA (guanosine2251-2'-O)-methyltransferase
VIALIDPGQLMVPFASFIESLDMRTNPGLVVFDEVHDPQNVGSVIRSAAAFGISAILFPEHNQAQITGSVVKVSAGMAFRIPLVSIGNVNQTVRTLKEKGFWVYGLDMNGTPVIEETFEKPSVFILGNEARGIREKTLELCDIPLSIPMHPRTESLNAATAAAIVMYQWSAHHPEALQ